VVYVVSHGTMCVECVITRTLLTRRYLSLNRVPSDISL